jgi:hypothetical protein
LGTLTYGGEGCHDERQVRSDVHRFFRRLRCALGGERFPYVWVPEWHKRGHGLHLHFALGQYVPRPLIAEAWGHGFVHIKRLGAKRENGTLDSARQAAGYLAKYVAKDFHAHGPGPGRSHGLHRYEPAQGFTPRSTRIFAWGIDEGIARAEAFMGRRSSFRWLSPSDESWKAPPAVWVRWDD